MVVRPQDIRSCEPRKADYIASGYRRRETMSRCRGDCGGHSPVRDDDEKEHGDFVRPRIIPGNEKRISDCVGSHVRRRALVYYDNSAARP